MSENWLAIEDFDYEVSDLGRVRRSRIGDARNTWVGRILKPKIDKDGYSIVRLCRQGKMHDRKVHRLVCSAFNGSSDDPDLEARHWDGDPSHNTPDNLLWGTTKQNAEDRDRHLKTCRGENNWQAFFSNSEVKQMRDDYGLAKEEAVAKGKKYVPRGFIDSLALEKGVDRSSLHRILSGGGYADVSASLNPA